MTDYRHFIDFPKSGYHSKAETSGFLLVKELLMYLLPVQRYSNTKAKVSKVQLSKVTRRYGTTSKTFHNTCLVYFLVRTNYSCQTQKQKLLLRSITWWWGIPISSLSHFLSYLFVACFCYILPWWLLNRGETSRHGFSANKIKTLAWNPNCLILASCFGY